MHSRDVKQKQLINCKGAVEIHNHCSSLSKTVYYVNIACSITEGNRACSINLKKKYIHTYVRTYVVHTYTHIHTHTHTHVI